MTMTIVISKKILEYGFYEIQNPYFSGKFKKQFYFLPVFDFFFQYCKKPEMEHFVIFFHNF